MNCKNCRFFGYAGAVKECSCEQSDAYGCDVNELFTCSNIELPTIFDFIEYVGNECSYENGHECYDCNKNLLGYVPTYPNSDEHLESMRDDFIPIK